MEHESETETTFLIFLIVLRKASNRLRCLLVQLERDCSDTYEGNDLDCLSRYFEKVYRSRYPV